MDFVLTFGGDVIICVISWKKLPADVEQIDFLDIYPVEISEALTTYASKLFCAVDLEVIRLHRSWDKSFPDSVEFISQYNNKFAAFVCTQILKEGSPKRRAEVIRRWIEIAAKCRDVFNFQSMGNIVGALADRSVSENRLRRTWALLEGSKSFLLYRELEQKSTVMRNDFLHALKYRQKSPLGTGEWYRPPIIPCCNMLAKFLIHADAKDTRMEDTGLLNFEKLETIGKVLREIQRCQLRGRYIGSSFHHPSRTGKVHRFIEELPLTIMDPDERYRVSLQLESRG
mmetsp:Transcript_15847/g.40534  ORF Transcript_15847/g.40534 Transcript_15847/m.40534 type:complete len:285 (+) Transcript_15847:536-1390(+)